MHIDLSRPTKFYRRGVLCEKTTLPLPKRQILDSSELKEFADDNFKFDENSEKLSK